MSKRKIYFCDYRCLSILSQDEYEPFAISLDKPYWYTGKRCRKLQPAYKLMKIFNDLSNPDDVDKRMYLQSYYETVLSKLNADALIESLHCDKKIVFVSFESSKEFGHKDAIALWLTENGYYCISIER